LKKEAGYSLIEVVVSIIILSIALLPMASMFDMGINSATEGSQYDKARALANMKLEEAKSLSFTTVRDNFPQTGNATPYTTVNWINGPVGFGGFQYRVEKHYMNQPPQIPTSTSFPLGVAPSGTTTGLIRVTVFVQWDDGTTFTTYGLVGQ